MAVRHDKPLPPYWFLLRAMLGKEGLQPPNTKPALKSITTQ